MQRIDVERVPLNPSHTRYQETVNTVRGGIDQVGVVKQPLNKDQEVSRIEGRRVI
jgi:hypothetical protein